ncbi:MAG: M1 family metallopeptidase [Bacteroidetes bacterium]|nr:M1 family metallopeptidase [Bacteroidota bacterium]
MTRILLLTLFTILFSFTLPTQAQTGICDITHYDIHINDLNYTTKSLVAHCEVDFTATGAGIDTLVLSLLTFTIDSIRGNIGQSITYLYNDTLLKIPLNVTLLPGDTQKVTIYYRGQPKTDPSGWGGFYFSGTYAFNLGVGFDSNPHNFGRAWFPANDVFTDRSTYSFYVVTAPTYKAFCNGTLVSSVTLPGGNSAWTWEMNEEIPTYLASIAVAPYYTFSRNYQNTPVEIACLPQDSNAVIGTFVHLDTVLGFFIDAYGPYRFSKVGYCLIPFNSGAMEHASSIHIGKPFVNGTLTYETLWAHELAHMWWGDWITCESEGDMWLNEGFASFNEAYMTEKLYGNAAYRDWIRTNHRKVLQFAHINDGGYLPLINIPHSHTYGQTVYNKGANVAHTLRHYMGDSAFFPGCQAFMNAKGNSAVNSYDLRDELSNSSGISMNRFFDDWVFTPGFPHFSIDSVEVVNATTYSYIIHTKQKSKGNTHVYEMPVKVFCTDGINDTTLILNINNTTNSFPVSFSFTPQWYTIDHEDQMSDAISDYERSIFTTGGISFPETYLNMTVVSTGNDTSIVRVEHHWVAPDPFKSSGAGIRLSNYRYWSISGILKPGFHSRATFGYNGTLNTTTGYLDNSLITGTEDSFVILYRASTSDDWQIVNGFTHNSGNKFDKIGSFTVDSIMKGEYTFGYRDFTTGINNIPNKSNDYQLEIWPNPTSGVVNFTAKGNNRNEFTLGIFDTAGRNIYNTILQVDQPFTWVPQEQYSGTFVARIYNDRKEMLSKSFILE